jgi:hypothetical protein
MGRKDAPSAKRAEENTGETRVIGEEAEGDERDHCKVMLMLHDG